MLEMLMDMMHDYEKGNCLKLCRTYDFGVSCHKGKNCRDKLFDVHLGGEKECSVLRVMIVMLGAIMGMVAMIKAWEWIITLRAKRKTHMVLGSKYRKKLAKLKKKLS